VSGFHLELHVAQEVLITGAAGMVGSHLFERLRAQDLDVLGTYYRPTIDIEDVAGHEEMVELDVRYRGPVERAMRQCKPATIYHLAAQSLPVKSWDNPDETMEVNAIGTINIFEAIRAIRVDDPGYDPIIVVACSSAEYGASMTPENVPIREDALLLPLHPYGVSKAAQDLLTFQYWAGFKIRGIRARIFNSTGPRKRDDVVSDFARRVAAIKTQRGGALRVGNIETQRAILDVSDLLSALIALAENGEPGEAYNICADTLYRVSELVTLFEEAAGLELDVQQDPSLLRPTDEAVIYGDNSKLRARTGWSQKVDIRQTVANVLDYELRRIS
jgi:GDP-4-dehydro-6-deoxy-D-mannose reductase